MECDSKKILEMGESYIKEDSFIKENIQDGKYTSDQFLQYYHTFQILGNLFYDLNPREYSRLLERKLSMAIKKTSKEFNLSEEEVKINYLLVQKVNFGVLENLK